MALPSEERTKSTEPTREKTSEHERREYGEHQGAARAVTTTPAPTG